MSKKVSKDASNALVIFAGCSLIWLIFGWKWALGTFLGIVIATHLVNLFGDSND